MTSRIVTSRQINSKVLETNGSVYVSGFNVDKNHNPRIMGARNKKGQLQGQTYNGWINLPVNAKYIDGRTGMLIAF